jgi:MoxR-like ATPase
VIDRQPIGATPRMNTGGEQRLVGVDVADAGDQLLIQNRHFHHAVGLPENPMQFDRRKVERFGAQTRVDGIGAEPEHPAETSRVDESQFDVGQRQDQMRVLRDWRDWRGQTQLPGHAQMDVEVTAVGDFKHDPLGATKDSPNGSPAQMVLKIEPRRFDDVVSVQPHADDRLPMQTRKGIDDSLHFGQLWHELKFMRTRLQPEASNSGEYFGCWYGRGSALASNVEFERPQYLRSDRPTGEPMAESISGEEQAAIDRLQRACAELRAEVGKVVIGQADVVDQLLIALFCRGHAVLVGVPGLAKTLLINTLARTLGLSFSRIQFTPDLMPPDITGSELIERDQASGSMSLRFVKGPIFANMVLADEINRTPPKTQAALLEAMQEHQVTVGGKRHPLPQPFFVLATQNPIEQEGTYPLPEAQLDRFMFMVHVGYPTEEEEFQIVRLTTAPQKHDLRTVLTADEVLMLQELVRKVPVADHVIRYALKLSRLTRKGETDAPDFVSEFVNWGAGPRASQSLILAGKARALLQGRYHVSTDDIRAVALPVLRHRIVTNFNAEAEGIKTDDVIRKLLDAVPSQQVGDVDPQTARLLKDSPAA